MVWSRSLPVASLIEWCRALRHNLSAGLNLRDVFRQLAGRGPSPLRPIAGRISDRLADGDDLEAALEPEQGRFPPLFLAMTAVGEQTGTLPEVFAELEKYFLLQQKLRRQFWTQSAWPLFQLCAAVFVLAGMLFVLGLLGSNFAPLGSWFVGVRGAVKFLAIAFGAAVGLVALYFVLTRTLRRRALVHDLLLRLPAVGPCLRAIALARFCLCLKLTLETALPLPRAVRLCLRATGNGHFLSRSEVIGRAIKDGEELSEALSRARVFPEEFLSIVATAEEGGRLPEVMAQQAEFYAEESERRLKVLTATASFLVWLLTAGLIIFMIFSIFLRAYLRPLQDALKGI